MIQQMYEELIQEVHKFYKDKIFFKALKTSTPETKKIIIDFLRKKGVSFERESYYSRNQDDTLVDYEEHRKPLSADEMKKLKDMGFKKAEIDKILRNKRTLKFNAIEKAIRDSFDYNYKKESPSVIKTYLKELTTEKRTKLFKSIINSIKSANKTTHREVTAGVKFDDELFGAASDSYGEDFSLPKMKKDDYTIKVFINTNEEFFVSGHDLKIEIEKDGEKKIYKFKINLMNKIGEVLDDMWDKIEKSLEKHSEGDESDKEKEEGEEIEYEKKDVQDPTKIVKKYFSKWYSKTKTGKLREVSIDRMPAEILMYKDTRKKSSSKRTYNVNLKNDRYTMAIKVKGKKMSTSALVDAHPDIRKWHEIYRKAINSISGGWTQPEPSAIFSDKIYTDDHDKFFNRLKFVIKKLAAEGWFPSSSMIGHKKRGGEGDTITFTYSEELKKQFHDNTEKFVEKFFKSESFIDNVKNIFYKKGIHMREIPREYIKRILNLTPKK